MSKCEKGKKGHKKMDKVKCDNDGTVCHMKMKEQARALTEGKTDDAANGLQKLSKK